MLVLKLTLHSSLPSLMGMALEIKTPSLLPQSLRGFMSAAAYRKGRAAYRAAGSREGAADECASPAWQEHTEMLREPQLDYTCPLLARKFPKSAAMAVIEVMESCDKGLYITNDGDCVNGREWQNDTRKRSRALLGATIVTFSVER